MTQPPPPPPTFADLSARARVLTDAAYTGVLTLDPAATITGMPAQDLARMGRDGHLPTAEPASADPLLFTHSVLAYMDEHQVPVTALDALDRACVDADRLTQVEFELARSALQFDGGVYWQVTARTHESTQEWSPWRLWQAGHHAQALAKIESTRDTLAGARSMLADAGLDQRVIWFVQSPLTDYQQCHQHLMRLYQEIGYPVSVVEPGPIRALTRRRPLPDMAVFPGREVYVAQQSPTGTGDGACRIVDPDLATAVGDLLTHLAQLGRDTTDLAPVADVAPSGHPKGL